MNHEIAIQFPLIRHSHRIFISWSMFTTNSPSSNPVCIHLLTPTLDHVFTRTSASTTWTISWPSCQVNSPSVCHLLHSLPIQFSSVEHKTYSPFITINLPMSISPTKSPIFPHFSVLEPHSQTINFPSVHNQFASIHSAYDFTTLPSLHHQPTVTSTWICHP